jgi:hypothetical protein
MLLVSEQMKEKLASLERREVEAKNNFNRITSEPSNAVGGMGQERVDQFGQGMFGGGGVGTLVRMSQCVEEEDKLRESLVIVCIRDMESLEISLEGVRAVQGSHWKGLEEGVEVD